MKTQTEYLALLRGINVGGKNIIKMADLKACFESMGFSDVASYIQSGNIIFKSNVKDKNEITGDIEKVLSKTFNYTAKAVVITPKELKNIIKEAPKDFGSRPAEFRYDVIFLKDPLTPKQAMVKVKTREGVDEASAGKLALYFSRLIAQASKSQLSKIITAPEYKFMTIRNWNTTIKLFGHIKMGIND
jgi:uncharacterized protein (DUF1697 family)